jgi:hypothetical protein
MPRKDLDIELNTEYITCPPEKIEHWHESMRLLVSLLTSANHILPHDQKTDIAGLILDSV